MPQFRSSQTNSFNQLHSTYKAINLRTYIQVHSITIQFALIYRHMFRALDRRFLRPSVQRRTTLIDAEKVRLHTYSALWIRRKYAEKPLDY